MEWNGERKLRLVYVFVVHDFNVSIRTVPCTCSPTIERIIMCDANRGGNRYAKWWHHKMIHYSVILVFVNFPLTTRTTLNRSISKFSILIFISCIDGFQNRFYSYHSARHKRLKRQVFHILWLRFSASGDKLVILCSFACNSKFKSKSKAFERHKNKPVEIRSKFEFYINFYHSKGIR